MGAFFNLRLAAKILKRYCEQTLRDDVVFERLRKRDIQKILAEFWRVMKQYDVEEIEDVKIIEKSIIDPEDNTSAA